MNRNLCFTLAHNLPSEVEIATKLLKDQNGPVDHLIIDLGFPLEEADKYPEDVFLAKERNAERLKEIAFRLDSRYIKMDNIGVSQNWTNAYLYLKPDDTDIIIGVDPDERPQREGWVEAMGRAMRADDYALVSLGQAEQARAIVDEGWRKAWGVGYQEKVLNSIRIWDVTGCLNWALIGISGKFLNKVKAVPYPPLAPRYGWIEGALLDLMGMTGDRWCVIPDYEVVHTCFSPIYGEWKQWIVNNYSKMGQPDFGTWIGWKINGII